MFYLLLEGGNCWRLAPTARIGVAVAAPPRLGGIANMAGSEMLQH
jgi:hypothetical protein